MKPDPKDTEVKECDYCEGLGTRTISVEQENGYGSIEKEVCSECNGKTFVPTAPDTEEKIRKGAEDFAVRFEPIMKELAEEVDKEEWNCPDETARKIREVLSHYYFEWKSGLIEKLCKVATQSKEEERTRIKDMVEGIELTPAEVEPMRYMNVPEAFEYHKKLIINALTKDE